MLGGTKRIRNFFVDLTPDQQNLCHFSLESYFSHNLDLIDMLVCSDVFVPTLLSVVGSWVDCV